MPRLFTNSPQLAAESGAAYAADEAVVSVVVDADTGEMLTNEALVAAPAAISEVPATPQSLEAALYVWGSYQIPLTLEERRLYLIAQSGAFRSVRTLSQALVLAELAKALSIPEYVAYKEIYILQGGMAMSANLIAALVRRSTDYDYRVTTLTRELCEIEWTRNGEVLGISSFSIEEARANGWVNTKKPTWLTHPMDMLRARALTRGVRTYAPDILMGGAYTPEEIEDASEHVR